MKKKLYKVTSAGRLSLKRFERGKKVVEELPLNAPETTTSTTPRESESEEILEIIDKLESQGKIAKYLADDTGDDVISDDQIQK